MEILSHIHNTYKKTRKKKFTAEEKRILRPIAEVIAIMDGNAFFGIQKDDNGKDTWYEQYLSLIHISEPTRLRRSRMPSSA